MSVTSRNLFSEVTIFNDTYNMIASGSVSGDITTLTLTYTGTATSSFGGHWQSNYTMVAYVDGVSYSFVIDQTKTTYFMDTPTVTVTKAHMTTTINKPFFTLAIRLYYTSDDVIQDYDGIFSFYDIENCPTSIHYKDETSTYQQKKYIIDGSSPFIVKYNDKISSDATFKVTWNCRSNSITKDSESEQTCKYVIPISWVNGTDVNASIDCQCDVYYGSQIYRTLKLDYFYYNAKLSDTIIPTISSVTLADKTDTTVPSDWKCFIQNQSGVRISEITCSPTDGSKITKITLSIGDYSVTTQSSYMTWSFPELPQIDVAKQSGNLLCVVTVEDGRGRTCSKTSKINILPYNKPKFVTIESDRCNVDGDVDNDGMYFLTTSEVEYSSCNNFNSVSLAVQYKRTDKSDYGALNTIDIGGAITGGDLDTEFSYDVRYILTDTFSQVAYIDYVSTAIYLMHFLRGGNGVAFGQKATLEDTLDCNFDAIFRGDVNIIHNNQQMSVRDTMVSINDTINNLKSEIKSEIPCSDYYIANNLKTEYAGKYLLDAYQGKVLNDKIIDTNNIINSNMEDVSNQFATINSNLTELSATLSDMSHIKVYGPMIRSVTAGANGLTIVKLYDSDSITNVLNTLGCTSILGFTVTKGGYADQWQVTVTRYADNEVFAQIYSKYGSSLTADITFYMLCV